MAWSTGTPIDISTVVTKLGNLKMAPILSDAGVTGANTMIAAVTGKVLVLVELFVRTDMDTLLSVERTGSTVLIPPCKTLAGLDFHVPYCLEGNGRSASGGGLDLRISVGSVLGGWVKWREEG